MAKTTLRPRSGDRRTGTPERQRQAPPRWLRFGPGMALALAAAVALWPRLQENLPGAAPRAQRGSLAQLPPPPAAPDLDWLRTHMAGLHLDRSQSTRLLRVVMDWDTQTRPIRMELDHAAAQFQPEADPRGKVVRIQDLTAQTGPVSLLSRQLADARRAYWEEAARVLTPEQRRLAEAAWTRHLLGRNL